MLNDIEDYNPNQYSFAIARQEGIVAGKQLMKEEVLKVISTMNQTKPMSRLAALIERIEVNE